VPLLRGRLLEDADNHRDQSVCVVDQAFAERYWPGGDPIGRRIALGAVWAEERAVIIVGEVANVKQKELSEIGYYGTVYFPYRNYNTITFSVVMRTSLSPASLGPTVQKAMLQLDPGLPLDDMKTMEVRIDESLTTRRSPAILAAVFAGVALLLAAIGTYGVLAYSVTQRQREIGVRMALGALPGQVLRQFLRLGGKLLLVGVAFGALGAWGAGRAMQSLLFEVGSQRTVIFFLTAAAMGIVVLFASFFPARRAARVSPMEALRCE
jgi:ABC-type antimicrobial peptide transport system permease subunit